MKKPTITVDELAEKILSPDLKRALPKVDVVVKEAGIDFQFDGFELRKLRVQIKLSGLQLAVALALLGMSAGLLLGR